VDGERHGSLFTDHGSPFTVHRLPTLDSRPFKAYIHHQMVSEEKIGQAVKILADLAHPEKIILFGSYARGDAREDSDVDFVVVEREAPDKAAEMVRLRRALRPLRIPVDILVFSSAELEQWGQVPGTALYWALREGRIVHDAKH